MKHSEELRIDINNGIEMKTVIKLACKKFSSDSSRRDAKIYNKNGVKLFESDFTLLSSGDILYIALKGKYFLLDIFSNTINTNIIN